jgi:hypothetical protein
MWLIIEACHGAVVVSESFGYQECATYGFQALQPRVGWLWIRLLLGVGMATISMPNEAFLSLYIQRSDSIEVFVKTE